MAGASDESRPKIGQEVEGPIEDLAYGGAGVMRVSGWVIMVRGAYPHDRIRARIRRRRKGVFEGDLLKILAAGPERVAPRCPHLGICGGCALQGLDPAAQTRYKAAQAVELLRRIGKIEPAEIAAPWQGPASYFYRNKMEFTFAKRPWLTREALAEGKPFPPGPALGLHPRGVYQGVFNIEDCQLQSPLSNRIVDRTREIARRHGLSVYDSHADEGLLRHLVIRQAATTSDLLIVIVARSEDPRLRVLASELHAAVPEITGIVA
ncbi:MAG: class I SAM-dependent RNA methyltransferase, partial [Candidatus Eisenbacteria sp.]|nr:class I SAM-dependent RNA methyltransferase [Candidatus Eisenbacteria bacterium]